MVRIAALAKMVDGEVMDRKSVSPPPAFSTFGRGMWTNSEIVLATTTKIPLFTMHDESWYASLEEKSDIQSRNYNQKSKLGSRRRETIQV
jgi:hypothetical protein